MTIYSEVAGKVKHMSQAEKLALLRILADSLTQEAHKGNRKPTLKSLYGILRPKMEKFHRTMNSSRITLIIWRKNTNDPSFAGHEYHPGCTFCARDLSDFEKSPIPALTPADFIQQLA